VGSKGKSQEWRSLTVLSFQVPTILIAGKCSDFNTDPNMGCWALEPVYVQQEGKQDVRRKTVKHKGFGWLPEKDA